MCVPELGPLYKPAAWDGLLSNETPGGEKRLRNTQHHGPRDRNEAVHMETKCLSLNDWIKKMWSIYTWLDHENIMLRKISQTERVKNHMISLRCGI